MTKIEKKIIIDKFRKAVEEHIAKSKIGIAIVEINDQTNNKRRSSRN